MARQTLITLSVTVPEDTAREAVFAALSNVAAEVLAGVYSVNLYVSDEYDDTDDDDAEQPADADGTSLTTLAHFTAEVSRIAELSRHLPEAEVLNASNTLIDVLVGLQGVTRILNRAPEHDYNLENFAFDAASNVTFRNVHFGEYTNLTPPPANDDGIVTRPSPRRPDADETYTRPHAGVPDRLDAVKLTGPARPDGQNLDAGSGVIRTAPPEVTTAEARNLAAIALGEAPPAARIGAPGTLDEAFVRIALAEFQNAPLEHGRAHEGHQAGMRDAIRVVLERLQLVGPAAVYAAFGLDYTPRPT